MLKETYDTKYALWNDAVKKHLILTDREKYKALEKAAVDAGTAYYKAVGVAVSMPILTE